MIDEKKELFGRFKHNLPIDRAPKFIKWLYEKDAQNGLEREFHHLLGATSRRLKLTDYLGVMVTRKQHIEAEAHKIAFFFDHLHEAITNLIEYIKHIEQLNNKLKEK